MDFPSGKVKITLTDKTIDEISAESYRIVKMSTGLCSEGPIVYEFIRRIDGWGDKPVAIYRFSKVLKIEIIDNPPASAELRKNDMKTAAETTESAGAGLHFGTGPLLPPGCTINRP